MLMSASIQFDVQKAHLTSHYTELTEQRIRLYNELEAAYKQLKALTGAELETQVATINTLEDQYKCARSSCSALKAWNTGF